jgi:probable F420-dependent oxidoreductase
VTEIGSRRRIRFGLQVGGVRSRAAFADLARRAEGVGFDTMLIGDHVGLPDPFVVLQAAADATSSLRLGTYVLNNDFYHPALLARSAATLDVLSDGRFELGVGAGHAQPEYEAMGVSFDDAARRVARLGEAVPVLRRLLDGASVTLDGAFYRLRDAGCSPRPCQARLPIVVGGNGASVLRLAARVADGVGLTGLGPTLPDGQRHEARWSTAALERGLAIVAAGAESRAVAPELSSLVQVVAETDDREGVARGVAQHVPGLEVDDALTTPFLLLGTTTEIADQVVAARDRWGLSYFVTRTDSVDVMEPVIAAVRAGAGSGGS